MIKLYICTLINISFISFQSESSQKIPGHYRSTYIQVNLFMFEYLYIIDIILYILLNKIKINEIEKF